MVAPGDAVRAGQEVAKVESRLPGNPPPHVTLIAPLGGLVVASHIHVGEPVEPDKSLIEITDLTKVHCIARVPDFAVGKLKPGATAHIQIAAFPDRKFTSNLVRFGTVADRESGTVDAVFQLENSDNLLRPGMRAEISIVTTKRAKVLSIPREALQGEGADRFVFVKDFELPYAFIKTPVEVGESNGMYTEIRSGLFPADDVVTRGAYSLSFTGRGNVSLKEALDAAHRHEHAEDGSKIPSEGKAAKHTNGGHPTAEDKFHDARPWIVTSGILTILLLGIVAALITEMRRPKACPGQNEATPAPLP